MPAKRKKPALTIGQVFAYRLRDARLTKRWKQQDLAEAMGRIGHPINRATIAKIEAGARGVGGAHGHEPIKRVSPRSVSLEEAIAFAAALDVSPVNLFLPIIDEDDVILASKVRVDVDTAHAWARDERALGEDDRFYRLQARRREKPLTVGDLERMGVNVIFQRREEER